SVRLREPEGRGRAVGPTARTTDAPGLAGHHRHAGRSRPAEASGGGGGCGRRGVPGEVNADVRLPASARVHAADDQSALSVSILRRSQRRGFPYVVRVNGYRFVVLKNVFSPLY